MPMTKAIGLLTRLRAFWIILKDPRTPKLGKFGLVGLALFYLISPIDLLPGDILTGVGVVDDLIVVPTLLYLITLVAPKAVRREALEKALRAARGKGHPPKPSSQTKG